jgi:hypothetical protein
VCGGYTGAAVSGRGHTTSAGKRARRRRDGLAGLLAAGATLAGLFPGAAPVEAAARFREVSAAWGVTFQHHNGAAGEFYMIETMGSGVLVWDYDGDGDQDLFFVDSGGRPGHPDEARSILYRNDGAARFVDTTGRAGIRVTAYGMGATAGDVDGDGDADLYVTAFGANQLFENLGDGTFRDATARTGVGDPSWSASATFADFDLDADLDLYVASYVDFAYEKNPVCGLESRGLRSYCHPDVYRGLPDRYFRNRGDGTFEEWTEEAGIGRDGGNGLGVVAGDLDGDGWPDLYVANDMTPNFLLHNLGGGRFEEVGLLAGVAFSDTGRAEAGMGVEVADLDGDGLADVAVTNLDLETNAVYLGLGGGFFRDGRYVTGLAEPSLYRVGFGVVAADFDQDGDLDLVVANGHIIHNVELWGTGTTFRQRNQLFENLGGGRFREVTASGLDVVRSSRGLACGDLDFDGDLDLALSNSGEACEVYENAGGAQGRWLQVDLEGPGANRFGIGAVVEVEAGRGRQRREVRTASSYLSQNALAAHFGLGQADRVGRLTVRWPGGPVRAYLGLPADRHLLLVR